MENQEKKQKPEIKKDLNYFETLNNIDVSKKIEKKQNLSYLSWAWAWAELKRLHPLASYTVYERPDGCIYWTDGRTAWVKTGVTVPVWHDTNGGTCTDMEHIEYLPVMNHMNKSIPIEQITSFDVNKAIQRSLTKAVARHGLGLYIYAGEDLPESEKEPEKPKEMANSIHEKEILELALRMEMPVERILEKNKVKKLTDLTRDRAIFIIESMRKALVAKVQEKVSDIVDQVQMEMPQ